MRRLLRWHRLNASRSAAYINERNRLHARDQGAATACLVPVSSNRAPINYKCVVSTDDAPRAMCAAHNTVPYARYEFALNVGIGSA